METKADVPATEVQQGIPARLGEDTPVALQAGARVETNSSTTTSITNTDVEPEVVVLGNTGAAVAAVGKMGGGMTPSGVETDVTVKTTGGDTTSTRTSKQLGSDLEKLSAGLSDKQTKLDTAKANLDKYKADMGDAADSKVVKKLEGEVNKAQTEYDKQLAKVKDKAEQRNATAAKEIDEKIASGSKKGLVGTEKGKLVDGEFIKDSAIDKGKISKKEFATEPATRDSLMRNEGAGQVEMNGAETSSSNYKKLSEALDRARQQINPDGSKTTSNFVKDGTLISSKTVHNNGITEATLKSDFSGKYDYSKLNSNGDIIEQRFINKKGDVVDIKYNSDGSSYSHAVGTDGTIKDIAYDSNNNIIRHTEKKPDGTVIDSHYKDKIIVDQRVSKPDGSSIIYSKNSGGATTTTYDADGYPIKVESVDSSGTKVTIDQQPNGNYRKNVVDKSGKLLEEVVYTNGRTTTTTYETDNSRTIRTEKNGRFTQTKYDANGREVEFSYDSDDGTVHKTKYVSKDVKVNSSYYTDGRVSETVINKDGSYTKTTFNKDKKPIEIIDSSTNKVVTHTKVYDDGTKLVHVKDPKGYESQVLYSRDNKPINAFENKVDGTSVNKKYDLDGNLIETISTSKSGTVTKEIRHTDGSTTTKVTVSDNSLVETIMKDNNGKVTREVSEYQNGTKYDRVINPDGSTSVKVLNSDKTYDIRKFDSNGKLTERQWTTKDGTIRTQTPLPDGTAKRHTVDANGNVRDSILRGSTLLEQVETRPDGSKQLYKVGYDGRRIITEISPDGTRNVSIRNQDGTFEARVLDSKGRIIEEKWSDKNGRITTERPNPDGTFSRHVVEPDKTVIDSLNDKFGNPIRRTETRPDGITTSYVRNSDGTYDRRTVNKDNKLLVREYKDSAGTLRVERANGDGTYSRRTTKRDGTVSDTVFSRSGEILHRIENRPDKSKIITERTVDGGRVVTEISKDGVSVRHVYDKYGNEVRPQPNVRQQPQQNGQRQSGFERFRGQQSQQIPVYRNAQEVVSSIRNPLNEANLQKIASRLNDGQNISPYEKIVTFNTTTPKTPPSLKAVGEFHSRFGIDRSNGWETYYNSKGTRIHHQGEYFDHITSRGFNTGDITDRLYLNISDYSQSYKFCELFAGECERRGIPYYFKTASAVDGNRLQPMQLNRDESIVIYSGKKYLSEYTNIASDIVSKYGFKLEEPPILTGKLKNNIGYGAEPNIDGESFNSIRSKIIDSSVRSLTADYRRRGLSINSSSYIRDLMRMIVERGSQCGIDMNNFCLNIE